MTTPPDDPGSAPSRPRRTRTAVAAELADLERHLLEVPPHSGGGRDQLESRRAALERELAALRADAADEA